MKWTRFSLGWAGGGIAYLAIGTALGITTGSWLVVLIAVLLGLLWITAASSFAWKEGHRDDDQDGQAEASPDDPSEAGPVQ